MIVVLNPTVFIRFYSHGKPGLKATKSASKTLGRMMKKVQNSANTLDW